MDSLVPIVIVSCLSIVLIMCFKYFQEYDKYEGLKLDKDTYDIVIDHLEKIIKYEAIYTVNVYIGKTMSDTLGANIELTNDQIDEINQQVKVRVIQCISKPVLDYFISNFGEEWLLDYIKIYSTSMILGYSDLSITSLVYAKNKKK